MTPLAHWNPFYWRRRQRSFHAECEQAHTDCQEAAAANDIEAFLESDFRYWLAAQQRNDAMMQERSVVWVWLMVLWVLLMGPTIFDVINHHGRAVPVPQVERGAP
jgi:hypothetical protein